MSIQHNSEKPDLIISTLMDGEARYSSEDIKSLMVNHGETWERYHIIQDMMRKDIPDIMTSNSIANAVEKALENEPTYHLKVNWLDYCNHVIAKVKKKLNPKFGS